MLLLLNSRPLPNWSSILNSNLAMSATVAGVYIIGVQVNVRWLVGWVAEHTALQEGYTQNMTFKIDSPNIWTIYLIM